MAKLGEGDARWIVQERADGTNVNGWHWVERDVLEWTKQRLAELATGLALLTPEANNGLQLTVTGLDSVTGEAIINNRKQKIIPSYELEIKFNWEGSAGGQTAKGKIHLPYVADENHDEDPEVKFVTSVDDTPSGQLRQGFLNAGGRQKIISLIHSFVKELRAGGSATQASSAIKPAATASSANGAAKAAPAAATAAAAAAKSKTGSAGKRAQSLSISERFYCKAEDIYDCFTKDSRLKAFTQSDASVDAKVGGKFSWFGGSVQGVFTALEPNQRISMDWRFSSWEDDCFSKVELTISEPEPGHTHVTMSQTDIPETNRFGSEDVYETTEKGWKMQVFQRIRQVFGYGVGL